MTADQVNFSIVEGDALNIRADVLLLKYAQRPYGLDKVVIHMLEKFDQGIHQRLPRPGELYIANPFGVSRTKKILFVGVKSLYSFMYNDIRNFAKGALQELKASMPDVRHVMATLHGANTGLDEAEALRAEVAGFLDAIESSDAPPALERISIVEMESRRAERLAAVLQSALPMPVEPKLRSSIQYASPLQTAGALSRAKPHIFVAMPFSDDMDDLYHYGIQRAVNSAGFPRRSGGYPWRAAAFPRARWVIEDDHGSKLGGSRTGSRGPVGNSISPSGAKRRRMARPRPCGTAFSPARASRRMLRALSSMDPRRAHPQKLLQLIVEVADRDAGHSRCRLQ